MHDRMGHDAVAYRRIIDAGVAVSQLYNMHHVRSLVAYYVMDRSKRPFWNTRPYLSGHWAKIPTWSTRFFIRPTRTLIIAKELYKFMDKNNQMLTMRPEGTAGILTRIYFF
jgi:hypothetical protein